MARKINYENRWQLALKESCGGTLEILDTVQPNVLQNIIYVAFREYLVECYSDQVKREFGPALAPGESIGVLQLKAALVNRWKTTDLPSTNKADIIAALTGELCKFKLPEEAYEVVAYLERGLPQLGYSGQPHADFIAEMIKHHRPASLDSQHDQT